MSNLARNQPTMQRLTRRSVLKGIAGIGATSAASGTWGEAFAAKPNTPFGIAVALDPFRNDPQYRKALLKHADILVPMNALKWASLRHTKGLFDFSGADEIINFARKNGKSVRGHTLLWYDYNPMWVEAISSRKEAEKILVDHIEHVVDRYRGIVPSWDVVNEVVAHNPLSEGNWRQGIWHKYLGPEHVAIAFKAAAKTDPSAKLVINDYDLENYGLRFDARRAAILAIVRNLQSRNIPIHGVGLQAHLYAEPEVDHDGLGNFIRQLAQMGVNVLVTELDVIDWRLSKNTVRRDIGVASVAAEFLEAVYDAGSPQSIVSWGITDKYSWISDVFQRSDGAANRPLPLDAYYRPKPFFDVIEKYRNSRR